MRPLLITDCDEVLLHMVRHFGAWLDEAHDIDFTLDGGDFRDRMTAARRRRAADARGDVGACSTASSRPRWHRQTLVPHAREALAALAEIADIVVLTNLQDECREPRIEQLARARHPPPRRMQPGRQGRSRRAAGRRAWRPGHGVRRRPARSITNRSRATRRGVHRLHMVSEPELAPHVPAAPYAHARIDDWRERAGVDRRALCRGHARRPTR